MSKKLARRDFLKILAAAGGSLLFQQFLAACGAKKTLPVGPTSPTTMPTSTAGPTSTPLSAPDLVVVRGSDPEAMIRRALEAFGGIQAFVPAGARVVVKPNVCANLPPQHAATTNPYLVGALVKLCLEAGAATVTVLDLPIRGSAAAAYVTTGIREQVEAAGGHLDDMNYINFRAVSIPDGRRLRAAHVYQPALDADVLINVPIAKDHVTTRLTLGMKNLMGLVPDRTRGTMHSTDIHQAIADLASLICPTLTVVDAIRILTRGGPVNEDLSAVQERNTIIVSPDIVAADSYATTLFDLTPQDIGYIAAAADMGLGRLDWQNLKIQEIIM